MKVNIQSVIDFCRYCHQVTHFEFVKGKGFCCPLCKTVHDLSNSAIPILSNGSLLDPKEADKVKQATLLQLEEKSMVAYG